MDFMTSKQAAEKWSISERRVRVLCAQGKVNGAFQVGRGWNIPINVSKPKDARLKTSQNEIFKRIEEKKLLLENKRPFTEGEIARLNEEFTVEFTYHTNALEGNALTLRETDMALRGITIPEKSLKDHMEAIGHKEAVNYIISLVKEKTPLTESVIKTIHSFVLMDKPQDKGIYRKVPVKSIGSIHEAPLPDLIAPRMKNLLVWYNSYSSNIIERIAKFHLEFESIHPFIDGNGKVGRLVINFELMKTGYPSINIKLEDKLRYYKAFDEYYNQNAFDTMKNLLADYLETKLDIYLSMKK